MMCFMEIPSHRLCMQYIACNFIPTLSAMNSYVLESMNSYFHYREFVEKNLPSSLASHVNSKTNMPSEVTRWASKLPRTEYSMPKSRLWKYRRGKVIPLLSKMTKNTRRPTLTNLKHWKQYFKKKVIYSDSISNFRELYIY